MTRTHAETGTRLLRVTPRGLECPPGGFHVDPWQPADVAVVTHAHADHTRPGHRAYVCAEPSVPLVRRRVQPDAVIRGIPYGERIRLGDASVSFHSAGHVLGSAQVRIEHAGEVAVVAGDYKREMDSTCEPFDVVECDTFVSEATFALPVFRWRHGREEAREMLAWWRRNRDAGRASIVFAYALGKAQRILALLGEEARLEGEGRAPGVFLTHGAVESFNEEYRAQGIPLPPTRRVATLPPNHRYAGEFIVAPPGALRTPWMSRFGARETAFASGWTRVRGIRRRGGYSTGFALSDHADWQGLLRTVEETGASRILATHGYAETLARHLREDGFDAEVLPTPYGEEDEPMPSVGPGESAAGEGTA